MSGGLDTLWQALGNAFDALSHQPVFGSVTLFLALIFSLSAMPKLRKPELAAMAIVDFGLMRRPNRNAGLALGAGELVLSVALAIAAAASSELRIIPVGVAAILCWSFVFVIAKALRSSDEFACYCFGGSESSTSTFTLARAAILAIAASGMSIAAALSSIPKPSLQEWTLELLIAASVLGTGVLLSSTRSLREVEV